MEQRKPTGDDLADAIPHIVWTHDRNGVALYFNRKWTEYTGLDAAETIRVGAHTFIHEDDQPAVMARFEEARVTGVAFETTYRLRDRSGCYRWHVARVVPLRRAGTDVEAWVGTATDVDAERRREDQQRFLSDASNVLGTSLNVEVTLADVARMVVPQLADWCAIDLLTADGRFTRPAVAHVDPAKIQLAWKVYAKAPPTTADAHGAGAVVRTGEPEHLEEISDELLRTAVRDPELLETLRSLGLKSSLCVPLQARGRTFGALSLVAADTARQYDASDLAFAREFARRISIALDNARLYEEATAARDAAQAVAAEVVEQSRKVEAALVAMRAERDAAIAQRSR